MVVDAAVPDVFDKGFSDVKRITLGLNRSQKLEPSRNVLDLKQQWNEFQKKMDGPPFVLSVY